MMCMPESPQDASQRFLSQIAAMEQLLEAHELTVIEQSERLERESEELYTKIFDYSNDAILVADPELNKFVDVNPKACEILGYPRQELLVTPISAIHPDDLDRLGAFASSVFEHGQGWTNELTCVTKEGLRLPTEISASSINLSGRNCLVMLVRDISERLRTDQALLDVAVLEERNRLARELHDSVTQALYSLTLFAEAGMRFDQVGDHEQGTHYLGRISETSQQALKEMRLLVYELRPIALERDGLVGALQRRFDAVERRAGVETKLEVEESLDLPAKLEEQLYRIAQEALNNSLKHSSAAAVTVSISVDGDKARMFVGDNGRGFDLEAAKRSGGMGLNNIQERVLSLEGTAEIDSSIGSGTKILISIPMRPSQPGVYSYPYVEAAE